VEDRAMTFYWSSTTLSNHSNGKWMVNYFVPWVFWDFVNNVDQPMRVRCTRNR
jgi:hypothetical protein